MGDNKSGKTIACDYLATLGAYKVDINSFVENIARHLVDDKAMEFASKKVLTIIRQRGYSINNKYWLNMSIINIPSDKKIIVIDNMWKEDINLDIMSVYQIIRPGITSKVLNDVPVISNDSTINNFYQKIKKVYDDILKTIV